MRRFAKLFTAIDQTQSTNEKVLAIRQYFESAAPQDAVWALYFLSGQRLKRLISGQKLLMWCGQKLQMPDWLLSESYSAVGDSAETVALLLPRRETAVGTSDLSLGDWMEKRILPLAALSEPERLERIFSFWDLLSSEEIFILNKILTGAFRVGVSNQLTLKALSQALSLPQEVLSQRLAGQWKPDAEFFQSLACPQTKKDLNPYPFYLAFPHSGSLEDLGACDGWLAEWKWDGIRGQGVVRDGAVAIWSRGNELVTDQFPEIKQLLATMPSGTVIDGEIIAFQNGKPMPFSALQKRLGRKNVTKNMLAQVPVALMAYDLLEWGDKDIRQRPLQQRRALLTALPLQENLFMLSPALSFSSWHELESLRSQAREAGAEGVMLKKVDSFYGVGRKKGGWWKHKVNPMTIDAVLLYAQAGSGRRANLFTDYTFGVWSGADLVPIAKAYSGLSQEEINELDKWIRRHTEEKFGPVRKVKAFHVFELAFEGIQSSKRHKSGVALRFPRIVRWRHDKPINEADTLEQIKKDLLG